MATPGLDGDTPARYPGSARQDGPMPSGPSADTRGAGEFRFREIAVAAYGPTLLNAIGHGAIVPVLVLHARDLGADVGTAALIAGLMGVGMLLTSLPAGSFVARFGERRTLFVAGFVDAVAMVTAGLTTSLVGLSVAMLVSGAAWTSFLIARQGYMIDAVPERYRARALSGLGGTFRIGLVVGPLLGALLIRGDHLERAFWLAGAMSVAAGLMARLMRDFEHGRGPDRTSVRSVLVEHRHVLLTLGTAVIVIGASRSIRVTLLPLWADHIGLSASTTSLIFAGAGLLDIALFLPGGLVMDKVGRTAVAVPVVVGVAAGCLLLPLTEAAWSLGLVMALIATGNGLGSGIVMTLGADAAPVVGRGQFLGAWRLCGDLGNTGGPLGISALAATLPLAAASLTAGGVLAVGAVWVWWWVRRVDAARRARTRAPDEPVLEPEPGGA